MPVREAFCTVIFLDLEHLWESIAVLGGSNTVWAKENPNWSFQPWSKAGTKIKILGLRVTLSQHWMLCKWFLNSLVEISIQRAKLVQAQRFGLHDSFFLVSVDFFDFSEGNWARIAIQLLYWFLCKFSDSYITHILGPTVFH